MFWIRCAVKYGYCAAFAVLALLMASCDTNDDYTLARIAQTVSVSGVLRYEDWEYDTTGYTGNVSWKAIRYAMVDLVDDTGSIVDSTATSATGEYTLTGTGTGLYIRVLAQSAATAPMKIAINNNSGDIYASTAMIDDKDSTTLNLDISDSDTLGGAFNMLDTLMTAGQFIQAHSGMNLSAMPVYWQPGTSQYGTYYCIDGMPLALCPRGDGMYVGGGFSNGGDKDHYDDDVLWHEFSHFIENRLNINDSPGGPHLLTDNTLDLRLAWSEGWGNYFSTAVKSWLSGTAPDLLSTTPDTASTQYIDVVGNLSNSDVNIAIDIDNPGLCGAEDCYIHSSNEVAVAKVLSQLRQMYEMQAVWDVYETYLTGLTGIYVNLESFWDGFLSQTQPDSGQLSILENTYNERQIFYQEDGYEAKGDATPNALREVNICTTKQCGGEVHYFYLANTGNDVDVVAFNTEAGNTYSIETFDLKNGADTYLSLIDENGNAVLDADGNSIENDDRNDDCGECINDAISFSSQIQFTPQVSGTYYVKVTTSPEAAEGAGRYGTYSIKISN